MNERKRFDKTGLLAINASAWGIEFGAQAPKVREQAGVSLVDICGPLTAHADWFWDNYDAIRERARAAFASPARAVALDIDSPGGELAGCFELARELRQMARDSGKRLGAFIRGTGASAAYALASAADVVGVADTGLVGSIGVISVLVDAVAMDQKLGLNFAVIASGEKKAYGNPHVPISDEARAEAQAQIDSLAEVFFALVGEMREVSPASMKALEGGLFHGQKAVKVGLADGVMSFSELLAKVADSKSAPERATEDRMTYEETVASLREIAEGDDEEKAKKAKAALKAMGEAEDDEEEGDEEDEGEDAKKAKAEADEAEEAKKNAKASARTGAKASVDVAVRLARIESRIAADEVRDLVEKHADRFTASTREWALSQPIDVVRSYIKKAPKVDLRAPEAAPTTRGKGQGGNGNGQREQKLSAAEKADLDAKMGRAQASVEPRWERNARVFPVLTAEQARAEGKA